MATQEMEIRGFQQQELHPWAEERQAQVRVPVDRRKIISVGREGAGKSLAGRVTVS